MRKLIAVAMALALAGAVAVPSAAAERKPLIVGGEVDATPDVGWIAFVSHPRQGECTGSLVAPAFVLTAAHCTRGSRARGWTIRLDSKDRTEGGVVRRVRRILEFPGYRPRIDYGDIALLRLRQPVPVEPVALVPRGTRWVGESAYIAGWGKTDDRESPRFLHSAVVPIRPSRVCQREYGRRDFNGRVMLCAGTGRPDICDGDSGGPLARSVNGAWRLVGVTSFGAPRCNSPSGYAWVGSKPLRRWLAQRLGG